MPAGAARIAVLLSWLFFGMFAAKAGTMVTVSGVAALRAGTFTSQDLIYLTGYAMPGDGGGGNFVRNGTQCTDDGGAVLRDHAGNCFYRDVSAGIVSPVMFGAACNNSANDYAALQATETAAHALGLRIAYPATNLCKTLTPIVPGIGVDHFCPTGMNAGDSGSARSNRCGVSGIVGSGNFTFRLQNANGVLGVQAPTFHDMYITGTGGGIQFNSVAGGFTDDATTQAAMLYPQVDRVTISVNGPAWLCAKCFWGHAIGGQWNGSGSTTLVLEGSDLIKIDNVSFLAATTLDIAINARGTFGNSDIIENSQISCPNQAGAIACIADNGRSTRIVKNYLECLGSFKMPAAITEGAPQGAKTLQFFIEDNVIDCGPSHAAHGLTVNATPYLASFKNNTSSGSPYGSASWNGGAGVQYYVNPTNSVQIFHEGNSNEGGFPFSSRNNFPEIQGQATHGLLAAYTPGGTSRNVNSSSYGAKVLVKDGGFVLPANPGNSLRFDQDAGSFTGMLDVCMLSSGSASVTLTAFDGPAAKGTAHPSNPALSWTCVSNVAYTSGAVASVTGGAGGSAAMIYQVDIRQHGP